MAMRELKDEKTLTCGSGVTLTSCYARYIDDTTTISHVGNDGLGEENDSTDIDIELMG
jgi:hypothetical protein